MHTDPVSSRYTPTSPLSPRIPPSHRPLSPQPQRHRVNQTRQPSRGQTKALPRFHPANFPQLDSPATQLGQPSATAYQRAVQPSQMESPRLMRERQRELIDRARMSSKIAASPMGVKPNAPRLDPLGSPNGPMTPLALEEAHDYFHGAVGSGLSPAQSPGARSDTSTKGEDEGLDKTPSYQLGVPPARDLSSRKF